MKKFALQCMRACGMFAFARAMSAKMPRILMYHNFSGAESTPGAIDNALLRAQFRHLRRHFHPRPLTQIVAQLREEEPFDPRSVAITIDDGRRNCYEFLFPLLKEFDIPASFFAVSSFIRREDWIWTDKVLWLGEQPSRPSSLALERIDAVFAQLNRMRPQARTTFMQNIAANMKVSIPREAPAKYAPCSWSELREMADSGLVEIGSHTVTHPILSTLTDEETWDEITVSRAHIEEGMRRSISLFCFPNGKAGDYRPSQIDQLERAGYFGAVVADFGMVTNGANPYELPRIGIGDTTDLLSFSKYLGGVEYYQTRLQRALRRQE